MAAYVLRRLLACLPLLWLIWTLTFAAGALLPGQEGDLFDSPRLDRAARERLRRMHGLDRPLPERYLRQLLSTARGDLGLSTSLSRPVTSIIAPAVLPTVILAGSALAMQALLGSLMGLAAAARRGRRGDRLLSGLALALHSLPVFWLGLLLIMIFALGLGWLPPSHMASLHPPAGALGHLADHLRHLALPVATLTLVGLAPFMRHTRGALAEAMDERALRAGRARGLPEWRLLWRHALRGALPSLATLLGLALPGLLSGALLVEVVFSWPGLGQVAYDAILARDFPVVQATTLMVATLVVLGSLAADVLVHGLEPRSRGPAEA